MKYLSAILLMVLGWNPAALAQLDKAAFPFSALNSSIKSLSLGNATVSLDGGYGNEQINPAITGEEGVLQVSPSWHNYSWPVKLSGKHRGLNANYRVGHSTFGFSVQRNEAADGGYSFYDPFIYKYANYEVFVGANYSHAFRNGFTVGGALNYLYSSEAPGNTSPHQKTEAVDAWSVDVGANYQFTEMRLNQVLVQPHLGAALTDFGMPSHYARPDSKHPMPTTLRIGGGTTITLAKQVYGQNAMELKAMQNVSKILARMVEKPNENGTYLDAMNPFKALFKSWDTYRHGNFGEKTAGVSEQLWWHSGVELTLLETLAFRWGYQKAGEVEKKLTYRALGAGINLYYVVFDYTYINNKEYGNLFEGHHWQITGRIPLDGHRPDTILDFIFD